MATLPLRVIDRRFEDTAGLALQQSLALKVAANAVVDSMR
jgi:hypothetical protein